MTQYWFISTKYRRNSQLVLITFALAFAVILLGAYTRLTNAGLSCPDWPHCYGFITAPHTAQQLQTAAKNFPAASINIKKAWTEMTHRYAAGIEGIFILCLAFSILFAQKTKDFKSICMSLLLIALLSAQVMLGMLTVTEQLKPIIVLAHLLTGLSILSVLWWIYLDVYLSPQASLITANNRLTPWLALGFILIAFQITLGGWVSTHYAGLACIDFPYCNGEILPQIHLNQFNNDLMSI